MTELKKINNEKLLQELRHRVKEKKLSEKEILITLENPKKPELITEYKKVDLSKLTKEDWKKACQTLEKDKNYQAEVELWDSIGDE